MKKLKLTQTVWILSFVQNMLYFGRLAWTSLLDSIVDFHRVAYKKWRRTRYGIQPVLWLNIVVILVAFSIEQLWRWNVKVFARKNRVRLLKHVERCAEDFLLGNWVLARRTRCRSFFSNRSHWWLRFSRQIHSSRVEGIQRSRRAVRWRFLHRIFAVIPANFRRWHRVGFVFQHIVGVKTMKIWVKSTLRLQNKLQLVQAHFSDCLLHVIDLRHVRRMPELVFVRRQMLILADLLHQRCELRFRANAFHIQLIFGQIHRDAESLLEWCIVNDRTDFIVLTRCVQVIRWLAEVRRWARSCTSINETIITTMDG